MGKYVDALRGVGLLQGDGVSEALELGDEALGGAGGVAAAVVVGAEVVVVDRRPQTTYASSPIFTRPEPASAERN